MTEEPPTYRAWKTVLRVLTRRWAGGDQHERLNRIGWDVLLVFDACRQDALQVAADWPIGTCTSPATTTDGWLAAAADSRLLEGATVASSNSCYVGHDLGLGDLHRLWETEWIDRLGNVPPEPVLERVDEFVTDGHTPAVGHIGPPHAPYIARLGSEWLPIFPEITEWHWDPDREAFDQLSQQAAMATGLVDLDRAVRGYQASVRSVWEVASEYVTRWVRQGLTVVVTADHGETFGRACDFWLVEHPTRCYVPPLTRVPLAVFADGERRGTTPETAKETLRALGYTD